jgi:hypothetical protein
MYRVIGLDEKDVMSAESFTDAFTIFYSKCIDPIAQGRKPKDPETTCYIEAVGERTSARMYFPFAFEFGVKAGLIKDGKLAHPLIEPSITDLIAEFSRASTLQMIGTMGCH